MYTVSSVSTPRIESISVKDVMSKHPITVEETETVNVVARKMKKYNIGSIIIVNSANNPIGIVTERDLVINILAENKDPKSIRVSSIMSKPLISVTKDASLVDAARLMSKKRIRRLAVMDKGFLVGIVTARDILKVAPEIIDILVETIKISFSDSNYPSHIKVSLAGYCDECGEWSDSLMEFNDKFLCPSCRELHGI